MSRSARVAAALAMVVLCGSAWDCSDTGDDGNACSVLCVHDSDCSGDAACFRGGSYSCNGLCLEKTRTACTGDAQCMPGNVCDGTDGLCLLGGATCTSESDCADGVFCAGGICVPQGTGAGAGGQSGIGGRSGTGGQGDAGGPGGATGTGGRAGSGGA
jgi:hypothetical protein